MALIEVKERIRKKKRRRRKRILLAILIIVVLGLGLAIMKSSWLDTKLVTFTGNLKIPTAYLEKESQKLKGENLLLISKKDVLPFLEQKAYFLDVKVHKKFPDKLILEITEKTPEINYISDGVINLLTNEGVLLETATNLLEGGLMLLDEQSLPKEGKNLYPDEVNKQKLIQKFRELQIRNESDIIFDTLDLKNMTNIKTYYEDLEIWLGYPEDIKDKLNAAINIIVEGKISGVMGYVDVSYLDNPVVFDESLMTPVEAIETPTE